MLDLRCWEKIRRSVQWGDGQRTCVVLALPSGGDRGSDITNYRATAPTTEGSASWHSLLPQLLTHDA